MEHKPGYVLVVTLMIISLAIAILTTIMHRTFLFQDTMRFERQRQHARLLALGGIQVALAQIALIIPAEKKEEPSKNGSKANDQSAAKISQQNSGGSQKKLTPQQEWLLKLLVVINKWQRFTLKAEQEGIDGNLELYISCEQGKIPLNALTTQEAPQAQKPKAAAERRTPTPNGAPEKQPGKPAAPKKSLGQVVSELVQKLWPVNIQEVINATTKTLGRPLIDPTELLSQESMKKLGNTIFISPAQADKAPAKALYLMDLFTVDAPSGKLNPWLLSNSVCFLLGFNAPGTSGGEKPTAMKDQVKFLQPVMIWNPAAWNKILAPVYGKSSPEINIVIGQKFSSQFEANAFSVISYGQVGDVTQKVCGILEKTTTPQGLSPKSMTFKLKKLYWL